MAAVTATESYYQYQEHSKIGENCRNSRFEYNGIRTDTKHRLKTRQNPISTCNAFNSFFRQ